MTFERDEGDNQTHPRKSRAGPYQLPEEGRRESVCRCGCGVRWSAAGGRRSIPRLGAEEKVEWSTQPTNGIALLLTKNPPTNGVVFLLAGGPQRAVKPAQTPQKKIKSACGCCLPPCHAITSRASQGIHGLPSEEAYSSSFGKASNPINDRKGQTCSSSSSSRRLRCFVAETGCEKNCPLLPRFLQKKKKKQICSHKVFLSST